MKLRHFIKNNNGDTVIEKEIIHNIKEVSPIFSKNFEVSKHVYLKLIKDGAIGFVDNGKFYITTYIAKIKHSKKEKNYFALDYSELYKIYTVFKEYYTNDLIGKVSSLINAFGATKIKVEFHNN